MPKTIGVTVSEMRQLREQGMSNKDIAASLDISVNTVVKYIGKQGCRMESLAAFSIPPPKRKEKEIPEEAPKIPRYNPKPNKEWYTVGDFHVELDHIADVVCIEKDTTCIALNAKDIPDLVQFLAWAMRTRFAEPEYNTQEE